MLLRALVAGAAIGLASSAAAADTLGIAIVTRDQAALRAAPRPSSPSLAVLWQGEALEVRGERLDYLQVWDYRRERGGFVRASQVRRSLLTPEDAPGLLSVARFLRDAPGAEALGIGFAAAYIRAAAPEALNGEAGIEALDLLGAFADRLARRASSGVPQNKAAQAMLSAHLEVAAHHGVGFASHERERRTQVCYDGDAHRRVLAMRSSPGQRARAALALTREECARADLAPPERKRIDEWRAEVLDRVDAQALPAYLRNRVLVRRAGVWSGLAYRHARQGESAAAVAAAERGLAELAGIAKVELAEEDVPGYNDAGVRVGASRWASAPAPAAAEREPRLATVPGKPGETCVLLVDAKNDAAHPLASRCTYGLVWTASATLNREGTAFALAVQQAETWRELWVFRKSARGWTVRVLPPATTTPELGYAEFAGWVPGGAKILVAREARGEGRYRRRFEVVRLDTLAIETQASDSSALRAFQRWQDAAWKRQTLALR
jgi:hypothetical protein